MFLTDEEVVRLTGRRQRKTQIEALRKMALPFFVNAAGWPVVPVSAIEGKPQQEPARRRWEPAAA